MRHPSQKYPTRSDRLVTFLKLAAENTSHFNAPGQAIDRWATDHTAAITAAGGGGGRQEQVGVEGGDVGGQGLAHPVGRQDC
ncbi:hypothetical protein, partial [Nocardia abscessus]|uniref:hypothetical protein n=1 Tax=Nocardia abscessus TaxID=120957 RepID=UPI00245378ED